MPPEKGEIISNKNLKNDYFKITFHSPEIACNTQPGQFVHLRIAELRDRILRRPFSICEVCGKSGTLTVVYKLVGVGTKVLSELQPGQVCDLMGPRGKGFTVPDKEEIPIIIAGGYGSAATYILAKKSPCKGTLLLGASSEKDLILAEEFKKCGFNVKTSTDDGSAGHKGLVTEMIPGILKEYENSKIRVYACGPHGMLMAVGRIFENKSIKTELSLDHLMCCGVGACFACVVKVKADNEDGWRYARTCTEGPVFRASDVYYD